MLYEGMLREMRDAAGDSGEFYTPRPVVRLMVDLVDPQLGESVLDPASGTGGFLVESFMHLQDQVETVQQRAVLQEGSIHGAEPKPMPYLLCQMNLVLFMGLRLRLSTMATPCASRSARSRGQGPRGRNPDKSPVWR